MDEILERIKARFGELLIWLVAVVALAMVDACPLLKGYKLWCSTGYWFKSLLPHSSHEGWAGLSFLSVVTGLNLALVKFESFLKSLEHVKAEWVKRVEQKLSGTVSGGALADERTAQTAAIALREECTRLLDQINLKNAQWWVRCRWWALRCTVAGLMFLFFQYSAGLVGLVLLGPVIGTYLGTLHSTRELYAKVDTGIAFKDQFLKQAENTSADGRVEIRKSLAKAKKR